MNGIEAVTELALFLHNNLDIKVFKFEKSTGYIGEYIAVNHLPFKFGKVVNDDTVLNVNVHVPAMKSGGADTKRLSTLIQSVSTLIPTASDIEDDSYLNINNNYYAISTISQPIEDKDNTYFVNVKIVVIYNNLKQ